MRNRIKIVIIRVNARRLVAAIFGATLFSLLSYGCMTQSTENAITTNPDDTDNAAVESSRWTFFGGEDKAEEVAPVTEKVPEPEVELATEPAPATEPVPASDWVLFDGEDGSAPSPPQVTTPEEGPGEIAQPEPEMEESEKMEKEKQPGFFARLFGRGDKEEESREVASVDEEEATVDEEPTAGVPENPEPAPLPEPAPEPTPEPPPAPEVEATPEPEAPADEDEPHASDSLDTAPAHDEDMERYRKPASRRPLPTTLDLGQAVELALDNNIQLAMSIMDLMAAREDSRGMAYYMEPEFVLDASMEEGLRKNTVEQSVSLLTDTFEEENTRYSAGIEGLLPLGTTYRLGYDYADLANSLTNRSFRTSFENQYTSYAGINLTQPLLKNFGLAFTRSTLKNARLEEAISEQNLVKQRMLTVANTELAYWEVWMQQELVKVRLASFLNARTLLDENKKRLAEGKLAEIEVEVARIGVVKRETQWLDASTQWQEAINGLANLLSLDVGEGRMDLQGEDLNLLGDDELVAEEHLQDVWKRHPDIRIKDMEIEVGKLQLKVIGNQRLPELNLVGSYGLNGLGATQTESFDDVQEGEFDRWSVGLVLRTGMAGGQAMKHRIRKAKINMDRSLRARNYVEKEIENRLQTTLRKVALLRDAVSRQREVVQINTKALATEQRLLEAGKSKTARLLEVEESLLQAREGLVQIQSMYRRSRVEMRIASARILEDYELE